MGWTRGGGGNGEARRAVGNIENSGRMDCSW